VAKPLFWNRLGSAAQVENSTNGRDADYLGGGSFAAGKFGGAYFAGPDADARVLVPKLGVINPDAGTIEFWGKIDGFPETIEWGAQPNFFTDQGTPSRALWTGGLGFNGNNGLGGGGLAADVSGNGAATGDYFETWKYDDILTEDPSGWHHYALVWNADGIPSAGGQKVAVYLDGELDSNQWDADQPGDLHDVIVEDSFLGLLDNWGSQGTAAIDNLKIWGTAKTNFSDRFVEGFTEVGTGCADTLRGSVAGDDLRGLAGNDALFGLAGNDLLRGDAGRDLLRGGAGRDVLKGGSGDDRLCGGDGADEIVDGTGRDALWGGRAADVFRFVKDGQLDRINDFGAGDRIDLTAWQTNFEELCIRDLASGGVRVSIDDDYVTVFGKGLTADDLDANRFIFGNEPAPDPELEWVRWSENGHWYSMVNAPAGISWDAANAAAQEIAGGAAHLVTLNSPCENTYVYEALVEPDDVWSGSFGPWIGLIQDPAGPEPAGGWRWVTGEPVDFASWAPGEPSNGNDPSSNAESAANYWASSSDWNDLPPFDERVIAYVVEVDDPWAFC
jgi:Ca2+-binding RTX toxin-like protein